MEKKYRIIINAGRVYHQIYSGLTYEEALKFCEDNNWERDYNGGLVWDMEIDEEYEGMRTEWVR